MSDTPRTDSQLADVNDVMGTPNGNAVSAAFARDLEREIAALRVDAEELANALRDVLAGHPVRNADELIARYSPPSQGDGYYAVALHPDGTSTDLKKPYCRDCGSNDVSMEGNGK